MKQQIASILQALINLVRKNNLPDTAVMTPGQKAIYTHATQCLNTHITLDPSVSPELGCAEAVSFILRPTIGTMPSQGFPGTAGLYQFLQDSPDFVAVTVPIEGDVVISPTGTSAKGSPHGHTGIVMENGNIASNDSNLGIFRENYTITSWPKYFTIVEGFPIFYFRYVH